MIKKMMPENSPVLESKRLVLRKFTPLDISAMHQLYSNPKTMHFIPRFAFANIEQTAQHLYQVILPYYAKATAYYYAIELKDQKQWIGYITIGNLGVSNDLGYALSERFWHQGYAYEAANSLIQHLHNSARLPFITATHDVLNYGSAKVMQKLGMHYQYSYNELWLPKNYWVTFRLYQYNFINNSSQYRHDATKYDCFVESPAAIAALNARLRPASAEHQSPHYREKE